MVEFNFQIARDAVYGKHAYAHCIQIDSKEDPSKTIFSISDGILNQILGLGQTEAEAWFNAFWAEDEMVCRTATNIKHPYKPNEDYGKAMYWKGLRKTCVAVLNFEREHNPNFKESDE